MQGVDSEFGFCKGFRVGCVEFGVSLVNICCSGGPPSCPGSDYASEVL